MSETLAADIAGATDKLRQDPEAARIFLPGGAPPRAGDLLPRPDLAATLTTIQELGWEEFYGGALGRQIVRYVQEQGGLLMPNDLADYLPEWTLPITTRYQNLEVHAFPRTPRGSRCSRSWRCCRRSTPT